MELLWKMFPKSTLNVFRADRYYEGLFPFLIYRYPFYTACLSSVGRAKRTVQMIGLIKACKSKVLLLNCVFHSHYLSSSITTHYSS